MYHTDLLWRLLRSCTWKCLQPRLSWLLTWIWTTPSVQFSSVTQSCLTLCDRMDCSTPGFPVHQKLPELTQTHVHRVSDAIQPSHPLLSLLLPPSIFPTTHDPMDWSTRGFPVPHQLLEVTQNSHPSSWWCHPTISSSIVPFSSRLQFFPPFHASLQHMSKE